MMRHEIFTNPQGLIEIKFIGELNFKDNLEIGKKILSLTTAIQDQGGVAKLLVDFTDLTGRNPLTVRLNIAIIKDLEFVKIAGFGAAEEVVKDLEVITTETKTKDRLRLFPDRAAAEAWLQKN